MKNLILFRAIYMLKLSNFAILFCNLCIGPCLFTLEIPDPKASNAQILAEMIDLFREKMPHGDFMSPLEVFAHHPHMSSVFQINTIPYAIGITHHDEEIYVTLLETLEKGFRPVINNILVPDDQSCVLAALIHAAKDLHEKGIRDVFDKDEQVQYGNFLVQLMNKRCCSCMLTYEDEKRILALFKSHRDQTHRYDGEPTVLAAMVNYLSHQSLNPRPMRRFIAECVLSGDLPSMPVDELCFYIKIFLGKIEQVEIPGTSYVLPISIGTIFDRNLKEIEVSMDTYLFNDDFMRHVLRALQNLEAIEEEGDIPPGFEIRSHTCQRPVLRGNTQAKPGEERIPAAQTIKTYLALFYGDISLVKIEVGFDLNQKQKPVLEYVARQLHAIGF